MKNRPVKESLQRSRVNEAIFTQKNCCEENLQVEALVVAVVEVADFELSVWAQGEEGEWEEGE